MMEVHLAKIIYSSDNWKIQSFNILKQLKSTNDESHYFIQNYPKWGRHYRLGWVLKVDEDTYDEVYVTNESNQEITLESYKLRDETYYYQKAEPKQQGSGCEYDSKQANVGYSVTGTVTIKGKKADKEHVLGRLTFEPSILTVQELQGMLFDIFQLHTQSFTNLNRPEQISARDLYNVHSLLDHLNNITPVIKQISHRPLVHLMRTYQHQSVYQKRSFDVNFELNKAMNPGLPKYKGTQYIQEMNILENQMIKQILNDLLDHANFLSSIHSINIELSNKITQIIQKVNHLLSLPLFKNVHVGSKVHLQPTQLFINDQRYRTIWRSLNYIEKESHFSIENHPLTDKMTSTFTYQIYETWLLFKMVDVLVHEMGWQIVDEEATKKAIDLFYSDARKNSYSGQPVNYCVELINGDFQVDILYEYENNVRPDFTFVFKFKGVLLGQAILDAKYKTFMQLKKKKNTESELGAVYCKYKKGMNLEKGENVYSVGVIYPEKPKEDKINTNPYDIAKHLDLEKIPMSGLRMRPDITHEFKNWFMLVMELGVKSRDMCSGCGHVQLEKNNKFKSEIFEAQIQCPKCFYHEIREINLY